MAMGKLLKVWLSLLTEKTNWFNHPTSIAGNQEAFKKHYEENNDPQYLMRAFNHAIQYGIAIPQWVIEGLDKKFDKYRPLPEQTEGTEWLTSVEVINRWGVNDLTLAKRISSKELDYYIRLGKWLSEEAQAVRQMGKVIYQGWTWVDDGEITFAKIVENLGDLAFSMEDVIEFETKHLANLPSSSVTPNKTEKDYEAFIRSLRVSYKNDLEIKIQEPGKPTKEPPCESLGFRDNRTREWKTLLEILQNKNHCYCVGLAHTKEYDQNRNILKQINIKLMKSFSKIFNIQIPKNFQLYELDPSEKPGTYRFKFQIKDNDDNIDKKALSKYYGYRDKKLLSKIDVLHKEYRKNPSDPKLTKDLTEALKVAFHKGLKTQEEIVDILEKYPDHFEDSLE